MATPSARLVIDFDANTSGIDNAKSKLEGLQGAIEADSKALKELSESMARLKGTAEVARWEALPKDIRAAENEVTKLSSKMAKLKDDFAKAPAGKQEGIFGAGLQTQGDLDKASRRLSALRGEQEKLGKSSPVKLFEDMKAASEKLKGTLGKNQTELSRMGGSMEKAKGGLDKLKEGADAAGSPLGGMIGKFQNLKALGPAAIYIAIAVALAAVAIGFALVIGKALSFAIAMSDAARSSRLLREANASNLVTADNLKSITQDVLGKTNAQEDAVASLAAEYSRLGLTMLGVKSATSSVTIATQVMGQQVGGTIKGLIDRATLGKRFWLNALDLRGTGLAFNDVAKSLAKNMKIAVGAAASALRDGRVKLDDGVKALDDAMEARFGGIARKQMLALPTQMERLKKNLGAIFSGLDIEPFLEKLDSALGMFKETEVVGKALKQAIKAIFQPLANSAGDTMPILEGFILGVTIGLQKLVILGLKTAIVFKKIFGSGFLKDLDLVTVGVYAGIAAFTIFAVGMTGLALTLALVAIPLAAIALIILAIPAAIGFAIFYIVDAIVTTIDDLITYMDESGTSIGEAASGILDAIIDVVTEGIEDVVDAFSDLGAAGVKAFKDAFGIASPAKKILAPAREIPNAIVKASDEGRPKVASALERLASPEDVNLPSGESAAGKLGNGGTTNQVVVNYYGKGSRDDANQFGEWLYDELETQRLARAR
jgi:hypothetical protein